MYAVLDMDEFYSRYFKVARGLDKRPIVVDYETGIIISVPSEFSSKASKWARIERTDLTGCLVVTTTEQEEAQAREFVASVAEGLKKSWKKAKVIYCDTIVLQDPTQPVSREELQRAGLGCTVGLGEDFREALEDLTRQKPNGWHRSIPTLIMSVR